MKIRVSEVWNREGLTKTLVIIEVGKGDNPRWAVYEWIDHNRPDLREARTTVNHGYHAVALCV